MNVDGYVLCCLLMILWALDMEYVCVWVNFKIRLCLRLTHIDQVQLDAIGAILGTTKHDTSKKYK